MKTSAVLASALLSAITLAAPVDKRALVYHTEIVTETVVVFTTVYDDNYVPEATTTPEGLFYEQPKTTSSTVVVPTTPAAAAPAPQVPDASPAPAPQVPSPAPAPEPVVEEKPAEQPAPAPQAAPEPAPAPAAPAQEAKAAEPAPAPAPQAQSGSAGSGQTFSDVDITVYDAQGNLGACGKPLQDTDMIAAIAIEAWGSSTYDVMTGESTNKWCGQKINVEYNGKTVPVTIMDMCPGCKGHDIDLSRGAWEQLTGSTEATRYKASWSMA